MMGVIKMKLEKQKWHMGNDYSGVSPVMGLYLFSKNSGYN